ncbi:MAG: ABC transporter permease [Vicinamibacterales bacterium]
MSEPTPTRGTAISRFGSIALISALLAVWQILISLQRSPILPGPWAVVLAIVELVRRGLLLKYAVASLFRVTWGFLAATVLAIPIGLTLGLYRRCELAFNPLIQVLRPISPLAWIPISILWFGVGDIAAIFLIFLASFLPLTLTAMNAVASIPDVYLNAGRNFGLRRSQIVFRVLYPAVTPQLILGLRITLGIAWLVVVAAEMIAVSSGLGFLIVDSRNAGNRYDLVVAGMVMIGIIGLLLDVGVRALERIPSISWGYSDE